MAQIDTASGVVNDIAAIGQAMRAAGHDALLMVDAVASLGCMPFDMDAWGVDVAMSGSQKGLMTPPGPRLRRRQRSRARGAQERPGCARPTGTGPTARATEHYRKYAGTPPEHLLYGLRQALDLLFEEGLENVFRRHRLLAEAVRRAVGVWAEGQVIGFNVIEPSERCDTVTPVLTDGHDPDALRAYCNEKCGVVLGHGIGELSGKAFRIAHMGHVNAPMILGTLSVIEMALAALAHPARQGRRAGGDRLARRAGDGVAPGRSSHPADP